jgi:hypothetical protein
MGERAEDDPRVGGVMARATKKERAAIVAARSKTKSEAHDALMRHGAQHDENAIGYSYTLDTPLGVLLVSLYEPHPDISEALWVHSRFEDVDRARACLSTYSTACGGGLNPYSGKWNFTDHAAFLARLNTIMTMNGG